MFFNDSSINSHRIGLHLLSFICLTTGSASAISNMFKYSNSVPYSGMAWGNYCYGDSAYIPLCGWTMTVTSSLPLMDITVYTGTKTKIDDFTFQVQPMYYNKDLTTYQTTCDSIALIGTFGNDAPEVVTASFSCVCTSSVCEEVPYLTAADLMTTQEQPATTSPSVPVLPLIATTTTNVLTSVSVAVTAWVAPQSQVTYSKGFAFQATNSSRVHLEKVRDTCYVGLKVTSPAVDVKFMESCGVICLDHGHCSGVNFMEGDNLCTLVTEEDWEDTDLLANVSGCEFWRVIGNS